MQITFAYFIGNERNAKRGTNIVCKDFSDFADTFKECKKGGKHDAYFVRGALHPVHRKDCNLLMSNLLVIDGDMGLHGQNAPAPKVVHISLTQMGLNHVIYTTHSHTKEINKFRCILPCYDMEKHELKENLRMILDMMKSFGSGIKTVKEMKAWSQPWFMPYRDNPEDGLYEYYRKTDGAIWETIKKDIGSMEESEDEEAVDGEEDRQSLDQMYEDIRTGKEFHTALRTISFQLVRDGMSKAHCKAHLKTMMSGSEKCNTSRWEERYNDIDRLVDGIQDRHDVYESIGMSNDEDAFYGVVIPNPPGALGDLYRAAYDSLLYQYEEVAIVSAIGVVAGIAGRRFNVMDPAPMGLNVYMTLVAGTGFGKERISKFIEYCLLSASDGLKDFSSFYGAGSFTSAKAIFNQVHDARSQVCVASEAGLLMKVRSGNVESRTAMILDMYSKSDRNSWTKAASFSNKDDSIPPCRAVAMTLIAESTERSLMEAFSDTNALESGYLPRQSIFKIESRQKTVNRNCILKLPEGLVLRLNSLMEECSLVQALEDPNPHELRFAEGLVEDMWDFHGRCEKIIESGGDIRKSMATRMFVKAVKYAGIATVFNKPKGSAGCLRIDSAEWEWGKSMVDYELNSVCSNLQSLEGGDMDNAIRAVCMRLTDIIINGVVRNGKCKISKIERKNMCVVRHGFEAAMAAQRDVKALNSSTGGSLKSGIRKVLEFLEQERAIKLLDSAPPAVSRMGVGGSARYIQLTSGFDGFCSIYDTKKDDS